MERSRKLARPPALHGLLSRSYSMRSSGVTRAGASERAIRYRSGACGWRIETWPKPSTTPWAARIRLAAARSASFSAATGPPDLGAMAFTSFPGDFRLRGVDDSGIARCFAHSGPMRYLRVRAAYHFRHQALQDLRLRASGAQERQSGHSP